MSDTPREVEERYRRMIMAQSPGRRVAMACGMFSTAKALARAGILAAAGENKGEKWLRGQLFLRFYGRDFEPEERRKILKHLTET